MTEFFFIKEVQLFPISDKKSYKYGSTISKRQKGIYFIFYP